MFKVNLLSDSGQVDMASVDSISLEPQSASSFNPKFLLVAVLLLAAIGGAVYYFTLPGEVAPEAGPKVAVDTKKLQEPKKTPNKIEPVAAAAVEETVSEVPVVAQKVPQAKGPGYPSENIYGQRVAINQMIKQILKVSGDNIGFASVVLQAPNYYYMHGLSPTQKEYNKFKNGLKKASSNQKVTRALNRGVSGKSKEFTVYGTFDLQGSPMKKNGKLNFSKTSVQSLEEIKQFAKKSGLKVKKVLNHSEKKSGSFKRGVVRLQFESSYKGLFPFVKSLKNSNLPVGILQLTLKSTKDENMAGVFDLVMYSK